MTNKQLIMIGAIVLGIVFVAIAAVYWTTPANALPGFFPGHDAALATIHYKHGLASLLLGLGLFVVAWFQSGRKSASQK